MSAPRHNLATAQGSLSFSIAHRPRITRRMHLELDPAGELVVVVPRHWSTSETIRLLRAHAPRVHRFLERARARRLPPLVYGEGGTHLYLGAPLRLRLVDGDIRRGASLKGRTLELAIGAGTDWEAQRVRRRLLAWYDREARRLFAQRFERLRERAPWADGLDLTLRQRRMRRTWGSCSRAGVIRLNTHLVKAPLACLDYVIAHELCHLRVMNHGPDFYRLQERLWPDWRAQRAHLRAHGHRYTQQ